MLYYSQDLNPLPRKTIKRDEKKHLGGKKTFFTVQFAALARVDKI